MGLVRTQDRLIYEYCKIKKKQCLLECIKSEVLGLAFMWKTSKITKVLCKQSHCLYCRDMS